MDNNDETLKLQYESELEIPNDEANGPIIVIDSVLSGRKPQSIIETKPKPTP